MCVCVCVCVCVVCMYAYRFCKSCPGKISLNIESENN